MTSLVTNGIPVSVAADPGAELEERRDRELLAGVGLRQRPLELIEQVGYGLEQRFVEEVQPPEDFLGNRGLGETELAGGPQQLDLVPQTINQGLSLPGRPAGGLEVNQPAVDPAVLLQDSDPLGFRRMGSNDGADPQDLQQRPDLQRQGALLRRRWT